MSLPLETKVFLRSLLGISCTFSDWLSSFALLWLHVTDRHMAASSIGNLTVDSLQKLEFTFMDV